MSQNQPAPVSSILDGFTGDTFKTVAEAKERLLRADVPDVEVEKLLAYARNYGLELNERAQDAWLYSRPVEEGSKERMWWIGVEWSGIQRIAINTGLWMPGKSEIRKVGDDTFAFASCYVRHSKTSTTWNEVSALARHASWCERDVRNEDLAKRKEPLGKWKLVPEIMLDELAQYQAACKALGKIITQHKFAGGRDPVILIYDEIQQKAQAARS